jgi:glycerol-3-phosphate O-acyltransferase
MSTRCRTILVVWVMLVPVCVLFGQTPDQVQLDVRRLSERMAVVRVQAPQATNVIALESEAGIVVIDTEVSPTLAAAVFEPRIPDGFAESR